MKWANKNFFNIYNATFFWQIKKNTCRYHYQLLDDIIYSSWDIEQNILKLVILGHFLPFYPPKIPNNQNFVKWKNLMEISFYVCVPKITIIWCTVPEILSEDRQNFLSFWVIFCPFKNPLLMIPKIKILKKKKKMKKMPGDIILLYIHVIMKIIWYMVPEI